jgi:A/G-specific adenine glycosylase
MITIEQFKETIWNHYAHNKREMPWRSNTSLYYVIVSEIMLQQTQVATVITKFNQFISLFPDFKTLSVADTKILLGAWSGLGYNNRALRLRECAKIISTNPKQFDCTTTLEVLDNLPGIGHATAAAILAYSYNQPTPYIETNIRRIFIHHFFADHVNIDDKQLLPLIEQAMDRDNPREWYWALMDYGSYLKTIIPNPNRKSKTHSIQSKFEGSVRQVRGEILRRLQTGKLTQNQIELEFGQRGVKAILGLVRDKVIIISKNSILLV